MKTKTKEMAERKPRLYAAETSRVMRDSIRWVKDFLERHGVKVTLFAHLTSMLLERPPEMTWAKFKALIRSVIQPRIGSVLLTSCTTGSIFLYPNCGNQPGEFQRLA